MVPKMKRNYRQLARTAYAGISVTPGAILRVFAQQAIRRTDWVRFGVEGVEELSLLSMQGCGLYWTQPQNCKLPNF